MYETLLFATIVLPGSALQVVFLSLLTLFCLHGAWSAMRRTGYASHLVPFGLGAVFLVIFCMVGLVNGNEFENVMRETLSYTAFLAATFFLFSGYRFTERARMMILAGFGAYLLLKFSLFSVLALGLISGMDFYLLVKEHVPSAVISSFMRNQTPRVVFSNDFLLPIFLFWLSAMYYLKLINQKVFVVLFAFTALVILLSLSRFLYLLTGVTVLASSYLFFRGKNIIIFGTVAIASILLVPIVIQWMGYGDLISDRLTTAGARSNEIKIEQLALLSDFNQSPLIGKGFGVDLNLAGRDLRNVFQAEVQWLGLMVKTGVFGIFFGAFVVFYVTKRLITNTGGFSNKIPLLTLLVFFAWMLAGWTNPVMFLLTSCINYLMFYSIVYENSRVGAEHGTLDSPHRVNETSRRPRSNAPRHGRRRRVRPAQ